MITAGDIVRFNGQYTYCGIERHGMLGLVDYTFEDEDGWCATVTEYLGTYRDGTPAYSHLGIPLPLKDLEPAGTP